MRKMVYIPFLGLVLVSSLTGCKITQTQSDDPCGAQTLQSLVGQPADRFEPSAWTGPVRVIPPNGVMTMDHRPQRLNVDVDTAGDIQRLWCG